LIKCKNTDECQKKFDTCDKKKEKLKSELGACRGKRPKVDLPFIKDFLAVINSNEKECRKLKEISDEIKRVCVITPSILRGISVPGTISTYRDSPNFLKNPDMFNVLNHGAPTGI